MSISIKAGMLDIVNSRWIDKVHRTLINPPTGLERLTDEEVVREISRLVETSLETTLRDIVEEPTTVGGRGKGLTLRVWMRYRSDLVINRAMEEARYGR